LARAGLAPFNGMQGKDLQPLLSGAQADVRDGILIEQDAQAGNFSFDGPIRARTYVTKRWRLSIYQGQDFAELYDLENDPHEMHNVFDSAPQRSELLQAMIDLMTAMQEESPLPVRFA
jgi:arylsulfatase A-like enzyme